MLQSQADWASSILQKRMHQPVMVEQCTCGRPWPCTIQEMLEMLGKGLPLDAAHTPELVE